MENVDVILGHVHTVLDHDKHFIINAMTRKIEPETPEKNELVQYDHNSERFTFEIPRYIDGHDMSLCDKVLIFYNNISEDKTTSSQDIYRVDDLGVLEGKENTLAFTWLIGMTATRNVGPLNFSIRFVCGAGDDYFPDYIWNTKAHSGVLVSKGLLVETTQWT